MSSGSLDVASVREAGGIVCRICPATGHQPTRMSRASWKTLCTQTRQREEQVARGDRGKNKAGRCISVKRIYCDECRGKILPPGLSFIEPAELAALKKTKEEEMATTYTGVCVSCGKKSSRLSHCSGDKVCSSCAALYGAIRNRSDAVLRAINKLKPELVADLAGSGPVQAMVESEALRQIAMVVGYAGEDGEALIEAVRAAASAPPADAENEPPWLQDLARALDCDLEVVGLAALQTAGLLEATQRALQGSRAYIERERESWSEMEVDLLDIKYALSLEDAAATSEIIAAIASLTHGVERFQSLARAAEYRADEQAAELAAIRRALQANEVESLVYVAELRMAVLNKLGTMYGQTEERISAEERENEALTYQLAQAREEIKRLQAVEVLAQTDDLTPLVAETIDLATDLYRDALADFALRVIQGRATVALHG